MKVINYLKDFVEIRIFGVCSYLGQKMGIAARHIRLFFIYATFATLGSPILLYMVLAFWINLRQYIKAKKRTIWD